MYVNRRLARHTLRSRDTKFGVTSERYHRNGTDFHLGKIAEAFRNIQKIAQLFVRNQWISDADAFSGQLRTANASADTSN